MGLRIEVNPGALKTTLQQLQAFRGMVLALAVELAGLQAILVNTGHLGAGIASSFVAVVLVLVYVALAPELLIFRWDEPAPQA